MSSDARYVAGSGIRTTATAGSAVGGVATEAGNAVENVAIGSAQVVGGVCGLLGGLVGGVFRFFGCLVLACGNCARCLCCMPPARY
jgi:hypothetical protein